MPKKISGNYVRAYVVIAFVVGVLIRAVAGPSAPGNWLYWGGYVITSIFIGLPGLVFMAAATIKPSFLLALRPLLGERPRPPDRAALDERIVWFTLGFILTVLGVIVFRAAVMGWVG